MELHGRMVCFKFRPLSHFDMRDLKIPLKMPGIGNEDVQILNAGFRYAHDAPGHARPPPRLGEHTREILGELGYGAEQIEAITAKQDRV